MHDKDVTFKSIMWYYLFDSEVEMDLHHHYFLHICSSRRMAYIYVSSLTVNSDVLMLEQSKVGSNWLFHHFDLEFD